MRTVKLIIPALFMVITSCSQNTTKTAAHADSIANEAAGRDSEGSGNQSVTDGKKSAAGLFAKLQMKHNIKAGDSVVVRFTIYNQADTAQQFCKWHTPFEPLMSKYLEVKAENGDEAIYKGAMAKRIMPPPASSYVKVNPKDSLAITIDLLKGYDLSKPGKYTISYTGGNMSGLTVKDSISFVYSK